MIQLDPLQGFRYFVTLDPADMFLPLNQASLLPLIMAAGFQTVTGLQGELEVESYAEGGVNDTVHQLPVRHSWGRITLKRGCVQDGGLFSWYKAGLTGSLGARRSGAIRSRRPMASVIKPGISNKIAASRYMVPGPSDCSAVTRCGPSTTFIRSTCPPPPSRSISAPTSDVASTASSAQANPIQTATSTNSTISANGRASTAVSNHMATFMVYRLR